MSYEESYKQAEKLKNFVSPYKCEVAAFVFSSQTEFTLRYFDKESDPEYGNLLREKNSLGLPFIGVIRSREENEINYYSSYVTLFYDISGNLIELYSEETFRRRSRGEIRMQYAQLARELLQMKK